MWLVHCLPKAQCTVHIVGSLESTRRINGNSPGHDSRIDNSKACLEKRGRCTNATCTSIGMVKFCVFYSGYSFFTQAGDKIFELISTLLSITKSTQTPLRMVSLLDVAISVLIHLKNVSDEPSHRLSQDFKVGIFHALLIYFPSSVCQNSILGLYSSTILTTKTLLPEHTLVSGKPMTRYLNI